MKVTEENVIRDVVQLLSLNGGRPYRIVERIPYRKTGWTRKSTPGLPDLVVRFGVRSTITALSGFPSIRYPIYAWIECKAPRTGRRRAAQETFVREENEAGGLACFANCREDVVNYLAGKGLRLKVC